MPTCIWMLIRQRRFSQVWVTEVAAGTEMLLEAHGAPWDKVAVCCINIDYGTPDEIIFAMFEVVEHYRRVRSAE